MSWKFNPLNPGYWADKPKNTLPGSQFAKETVEAYRRMGYGGIDWPTSVALTGAAGYAAGKWAKNQVSKWSNPGRKSGSSWVSTTPSRPGGGKRKPKRKRPRPVRRPRRRGRRPVRRGRASPGRRAAGGFKPGSRSTIRPGRYVLKYKATSLFAYNPQKTLQAMPENNEYYLPRMYFNAYAAHYPLASWTGCIAIPKPSVSGWKSQPSGWDVLARRYLKYFCYGSTLNFAILNPSAADTEALDIGSDNSDSDWFRIYSTGDASTNWPLPEDPDPPTDNVGRWGLPVARTSKVSFFKSRRTANATEFGNGASRLNIESLMFESDTLVDDRIGPNDMTNEALNYSRMSAYCQQMFIPPRKQRQLSGVHSLDLTGTQETRMFGSMSCNYKFLPRHKIKIYKKIRRTLSDETTQSSRPAATGVGPWRLTKDQDVNEMDLDPAESDQQFGCYVIQFDDITQKTESEWNLIELAVEINYRCKFFGDKTKSVDQHHRYANVGSDAGFILNQDVNTLFLHNKTFSSELTSHDPHTYVSTAYRTFGTAWPTEFNDVESWQKLY